MGIIYLDIDDEITSAANRIRSSRDARLALVLPGGSRLATSRINFRLLAREAVAYRRELAIVAPEPAARALAAAAGLPVFTSVAEYEAAVAALDEPMDEEGAPDSAAGAGPVEAADAVGAGEAIGAAGTEGTPSGNSGARAVRGTSPRGLAPKSDPLEATRVLRPGAPAARSGGAAAARTGRSTDVQEPASTRSLRSGGSFEQVRARPGVPTETIVLPPDERPDRPRRPRGLLVALVALASIVLVIGGLAAWLLLPDAVIIVRARAEVIGPMQFTIKADPQATAMDPKAGVVPAQVATFDLSAQGSFPSTGKKVTDTRASGTVRWTNCDPTRAYTIQSGTVAKTDSGVGFVTTADVFLPVAILSGSPPQISCQSRVVMATASLSGASGNVAAGAIDQVPTGFNSVVIRVTNPAATTGGSHVETKIVAQKDIDKATASLQQQLTDQLNGMVADPSQAPAGTTVFPATMTASTPETSVDPSTLLGQAMDTFDLGMSGTGTATAVDESLVQQLADERIRAAATPGESLVAGSVQVQVGTAKVAGAVVSFPVMAQASQVGTLDAATIRDLVKGRGVDEVRALLRNYGDATIDVWPGWVTTIPTIDFRLDVQTVSNLPIDSGPVPGESGEPSFLPTFAPAGSSVPPFVLGPSTSPAGSATPGTSPAASGRTSSARPSSSPSVVTSLAPSAAPSPVPSGTP